MKSLITTLFVPLLVAGGTAHADTAEFDEAMQPIFKQYQTIHKALSGDTTKGVAGAAKTIAKLAPRVDPRTVSGKHADHYRDLPKKIKAATTSLSKAKGIDRQREAFKELSRPMAMWATMSKPEGINVVFCSMAKGSWLQTDKQIANPYYGAKMLRCGEVVSGKDQGTSGGHMKHGQMKHGDKKHGHGH